MSEEVASQGSCPEPQNHSSSGPPFHAPFKVQDVEPWADPVDANALLNDIVSILNRFVVLPRWVPETIALWDLHTYAFHLRDVSVYLGIESPEHRCGKSTLLSVLRKLASRSLTSANISSPAFFRAIETLRPTLLIDEADTFLAGNDELKGILNAGYTPDTGYVMRVSSDLSQDSTNGSSPSNHQKSKNQGPQLVTFSCWCPKVIARIGRLPPTLADRCIIIRMQRKLPSERCERVRTLNAIQLQRHCVRFVLDHREQIANAQPRIPESLNDRAADIWEPLLVLADLAGGNWPQLARQAATALSAGASDQNPIGSLLADIFLIFALASKERVFTRDLLIALNGMPAERPWKEMARGKPLTEIALSQKLRPYGVKPRTIWIGQDAAKGYLEGDFKDAFRRYMPKADIEDFLAEHKPGAQNPPTPPSSDSPELPSNGSADES